MTTHESMRSEVRAPRLVLVAATCLLAAGCASSGSSDDMAAAMPPQAPPPSVGAAAANQRLFAAASADQVVDGAVEPSAEYRLGTADRVNVTVFGAETFSGEFAVDETGSIAIPLLGPVPASDHTPRELEDALEARLRETYMRDPHVTVQVTQMQSHGVSVLGAVNSPGVYQVVGRTTLLDVLAMAQGLSEQAGNKVVVSKRNGGPNSVIEVDLSTVLWSDGAGTNVEIGAGDVVQVHSASLVYVVGDVNNPGGFTMPFGEQMTVLQALAMAQGTTSTAARGRSVIVRTRPDGSREEIPVDLGEVLNGSQPPPVLSSSDVLYVPRSGTRAATLGAVNALVRMVTLRGLFN